MGCGGGDVAASRTAKRLAQCAGQDIDLDAGPVRRAAALRSDEAGGVAIIDHDQRVIRIGKFANVAKLGKVAVHREHAIGDDDDAAGTAFPGCLHLGLEVIHVAIGEAEAPGLGEPDAVDDRGMVQGIRDDGILLAEQGFEYGAIGIETGSKQDRVIHAKIIRDAALERQVQIGGAADEAHRGHAEAVAVERRFCGSNQIGMIGEAEVIVGAEVQHLASAGDGDVR